MNEQLNELQERLNRCDQFAHNNGMQVTQTGNGFARAELTVEERHLNAAGICQGGVYFTLADLAFAAVSNTHGRLALGVQNSITFVRKAQLGDHLTAECHEVAPHHRLPFFEVRITNQRGEMLCVVTGSAYVTRTPLDEVEDKG